MSQFAAKTMPAPACFERARRGNGGIHARGVNPPGLHIEDETASAASFAQAFLAFLSTRKEHAPGGNQERVRDHASADALRLQKRQAIEKACGPGQDGEPPVWKLTKRK